MYIYTSIFLFFIFASPPSQRIARRTPAGEQGLTRTHREPQPETGRRGRTTDVAASAAHKAPGTSVCPLPRPWGRPRLVGSSAPGPDNSRPGTLRLLSQGRLDQVAPLPALVAGHSGCPLWSLVLQTPAADRSTVAGNPSQSGQGGHSVVRGARTKG